MNLTAAVVLDFPCRRCEDFPGLPESVPALRRWLAALLADTSHDLHAVTLCASELATNAILHTRSAGTTFTVWVGWSPSLLRVVVIDNGPLPAPNIDRERVGGWGLSLVDAYSHANGTDQVAGGRSTWFELHREAP